MKLLESILLFLALISHAKSDRKADAMKIILQKLNDPESYDKNIMPPTYNRPLDVYVTLLIRSMELDDLHMRMNTDLTFRMQWKDERLRYAIRDVPDITLVDYQKLWIPDPFFKRSQNTKLQQTIHPEAYIRIKGDGIVLFSSRFVISSYCPMEFHRFPHDKQICEIQLASYGYKLGDVRFSSDNSAIKLMDASNPVMSSRFQMGGFKYGPCQANTTTGEYSCIKATFTLYREFKTYLLEWYIPCIFLVIVAFFSELISADNLVPRLLLTLAPMLTLSATAASYRSNVPSVPYPTALDLFTGISLMVIFAMLLHVILSYYKANKPKKEEKPKEATGDDEIKEIESSPQKTKMQKLKGYLKEKSDVVIRAVIISFYCAFVFLYFAAYTI